MTRDARREARSVARRCDRTAGLDAEGRRFLDGRLDAEAIARVRGERRAVEPVRVYAGLAHGATIATRVERALADLERAGGFDRRRLVVGSPTGLGWLNPTAVEAEELMSGGDVATVVVQYGNQRSWRSRRRVPAGRDTHRALLEALAERLAGSAGPELVVYAESLGAWASLCALDGPDHLDHLGVVRGLWVGLPYEARAHRDRVVPAAADRRFGAFDSAADLDRLSDERLRALRYAFLTRPDDPVATFEGPRTLYAPPRERTQRRWLPGVFALLSLRDIVRATDPVPGRLGASGHDYRGELASAVRAAFGHHDVDESTFARIEQALLACERRRAADQGAAT